METSTNSKTETTMAKEVSKIRAKFLRDYPNQAAYEELQEQYTEVRCGDDEVDCVMFCMMDDLRLCWAAAKAVFGEQATPEMAWKMCEKMNQEVKACQTN